MEGKIICINKYIHRVLLSNNTIIDTRTRGKLRNNNISPVVGDNVEVNLETKTIEKVFARRNYLERPLIANIDKFLLIAYSNNIEPIIIITKIDMISVKEKLEIKKYINYYRKLGIKVYVNSSTSSLRPSSMESIGYLVISCLR